MSPSYVHRFCTSRTLASNFRRKKVENFQFVKYLDSKVRLGNKNHLLESMAMSDLKWARSISFICACNFGFKWVLDCHLIYNLS